MKVYLVEEHTDDNIGDHNYQTLVFGTREKAVSYVKDRNSVLYRNFEVEEMLKEHNAFYKEIDDEVGLYAIHYWDNEGNEDSYDLIINQSEVR